MTTTDRPKITLLISTYNWVDALKRVLEGVLKQTILPNEIVIADDGSRSDTKLYIDTIDGKVKEMFQSIGYNNGVFFFQALPENDKIYIYEMGLRTGGGMNYKITEATSGNNDLEMLIHYAITGEMCEPEDIKLIDPYLKGKRASSFAIPLRVGTIGEVVGAEIIPSIDGVVNFTHFCEVGDTIQEKHINTLSQLYGRVMIVRDNMKSLLDGLKEVRNTIRINDTEGKDMILWETFDKICSEEMANYM